MRLSRTIGRVSASTSAPTGHVDEEDPLPAGVLREDAAEEHAGRCAAAAHRAPDAERLVALRALLERRRDDRERRRRDDRRADAPAPRAPRSARRSSSASPQASDAAEKSAIPIMNMPPPPEQVGRAPAEQQEAAERDRVRDEHPLQRVLRHVQRRLDRRQRDVDDRDVEHRHEERDADERERLPAARIRSRERSTPVCSFVSFFVFRDYWLERQLLVGRRPQHLSRRTTGSPPSGRRRGPPAPTGTSGARAARGRARPRRAGRAARAGPRRSPARTPR